MNVIINIEFIKEFSRFDRSKLINSLFINQKYIFFVNSQQIYGFAINKYFKDAYQNLNFLRTLGKLLNSI